MNCIEEQLIQKYIDGECSEQETEMVEEHLLVCSECAGRLEEKRKLSVELKQLINSLSTNNIEIPPFTKRRMDSGKKLKIFIYSLSAACILLFVLFLFDKRSNSDRNQITILQNIPREIDANRPASEQDFVIEVYDDFGHQSGCFNE